MENQLCNNQKVWYLQWLIKVFRPSSIFHYSLCWSLVSKYKKKNQIFPHHDDSPNPEFYNFLQMKRIRNIPLSIIPKYSEPLLSHSYRSFRSRPFSLKNWRGSEYFHYFDCLFILSKNPNYPFNHLKRTSNTKKCSLSPSLSAGSFLFNTVHFSCLNIKEPMELSFNVTKCHWISDQYQMNFTNKTCLTVQPDALLHFFKQYKLKKEAYGPD